SGAFHNVEPRGYSPGGPLVDSSLARAVRLLVLGCPIHGTLQAASLTIPKCRMARQPHPSHSTRPQAHDSQTRDSRGLAADAFVSVCRVEKLRRATGRWCLWLPSRGAVRSASAAAA